MQKNGNLKSTLIFIVAIVVVFVIVRSINFSSTTVTQVSDPSAVPVDQRTVGDKFTGIMKSNKDGWTFMTNSKYPETRKLEFVDSSVCKVLQEVGPCFALKVYFGQGNTTSTGGGDNVEIIGERTNTGLLVKSLTLVENFVLNGTFTKNGDAYSITDKMAGTIPLSFDAQSVCKMGDTVIEKCDMSKVKNGMPVFIHGLLYKHSIFVRSMVVITQTAPSTSPVPNR